MWMSALMDGPWSDHLLPVLCLLFLLCDRDHGAVSPCVNELLVRRNTALKAVPLKQFTINCTVKHCGDAPNVTWCKVLDTVNCEAMIEAENIKVIQNERSADEVISFLVFKKISMEYQGHYRCKTNGSENSAVSHSISVNVSESTEGFDSNGNITGTNKAPMEWLPYVGICTAVFLLVIMVTAISFFLHGCEGTTACANIRTKEQEVSTSAPCPDPSANPKGTPPSSSDPNHNRLNHLYENSITGTLPQGYLLMSGTLPLSDLTDRGQGSSQLVYAALNHQTTSGTPKPCRTQKPQEECTEYAAIRVY